MIIKVDQSKIDLARDLLRGIKNGSEKAVATSINRTLVGVKTQLSSKIRDKYFIKAKDLNSVINITKASPSNPSGRIDARGTRLPLIRFNVNPKNPRRIKMVSAGVYAGGRKGLPGAFVQKTKKGNIGIFHREGAERYPIFEKFGPSIPQMMNQIMLTTEDLQNYTNERFERELDHEVMRLQNGYGK